MNAFFKHAEMWDHNISSFGISAVTHAMVECRWLYNNSLFKKNEK